MTRKAFTLVEVMIVVLIIGILVAIAVPNFFSARENSRQKTCLENLRQINEAKDMWSTASNATSGTVVEVADISPAYIDFSRMPGRRQLHRRRGRRQRNLLVPGRQFPPSNGAFRFRPKYSLLRSPAGFAGLRPAQWLAKCSHPPHGVTSCFSEEILSFENPLTL